MIPIRWNIERKSKTHPGSIIFDRGSLDFFRQRRFCPRSSFVPGIHRRQEAIRSFPIRERDSRAHFPGSTRVALYLETGSGRSEKTAVELPSWRETPHVSRSRFLFPRERYPWYYLYCSFNRENQAFFRPVAISTSSGELALSSINSLVRYEGMRNWLLASGLSTGTVIIRWFLTRLCEI